MALKRRKLREARIKAGLSQEALAEEFETTRVTISHWENAVTEPYPHFKRKLEDHFGIDVEILLAITDENAEATSGKESSSSISQEALLEETNTSEALPASAATSSPTVTSC